MQRWTLVFFAGASCAAVDLSEFTESLKGMAFWASWGAANERKYGKDFGSWEHQWAKATSSLDEVKDVIEDENIATELQRMSLSASWGAANERAYGKSRSDSQVDWTMHRQHAAKLKDYLKDDALVDALQEGSFNAAWWASNSQKYASQNPDAAINKKQFEGAMMTVKNLAPKSWPVQAIEELFHANSWGAASHRAAHLSQQRFMRSRDQKPREDWPRYEEHSKRLKKYLGTDQSALYEHLEAMAINAAWGATNERTYGRSSYDAQSNWGKFNFHKDAGKSVYKGPVQWQDIADMMTGAAWGAANERAYGKKSQEARSAWSRFEDHAAKVLATADRKEEL